MTNCSDFKVVVIGGGLVGSLASVYFAKREKVLMISQDIRSEKHANGRSINLTLATRGIEALEGAGIQDLIQPELIPLKGRFIHSLTGNHAKHPYGTNGECINSVSRKVMNERLLTAAEKQPQVKLNFSTGLEFCDFDTGKVTVINDQNERRVVEADLIIGADGAYSRMRQQLNRKIRMNFSQEYIDHLYIELRIPPAADGKHIMDSDHLHIWPRETFMMIACPNLNGSFTVTLFMPKDKFESIKTPEQLLEFFENTFPDAVPLIGKENLVEDYFDNPKSSLISVKCDPYHYQDKAVILGDAAHAMVPFYGQGMNCGMEDVLVLDEIFSKHVPQNRPPSKQELETILNEYTETRRKDAHTICDLAQQNYIELRSGVINPTYMERKKLELALYHRFPNWIIPLYTMVSFTRIPYSKAVEQNKHQARLFEYYLKAKLVGKIAAVALCGSLLYPVIRKFIQ
ncbi:hypothetical protein HDV06_001671 [Boothiomyces sp. JEL0866]|nr:hypothetical protein HDV06_001671 [Boothiomyces sp. JEL0866]